MQRQKTGSDDDSNHVCLKFCSGMDGVLSVFPNRYHKLHTTKSWEFIGLPQTARRNVKRESNIIVGLLDTGSRIYFNIHLVSSGCFVVTKDNNDVVFGRDNSRV